MFTDEENIFAREREREEVEKFGSSRGGGGPPPG